MIWTEPRAMNTHESALYSSEILKAHGIRRVILVTEANSMPRAVRSFTHHGIAAVPAPSRYIHLYGNANDLWPGWDPIALNEETVHELVGLVWYKLRGWI